VGYNSQQGECELSGRSLIWRSSDSTLSLAFDLRHTGVLTRILPMGRALLKFTRTGLPEEPGLLLSKVSSDPAQPSRSYQEVRTELLTAVRIAQSDAVYEATQFNRSQPWPSLLAFDDDQLGAIVRHCADHDLLAIASTCRSLRQAIARSHSSRAVPIHRSFSELFRASPRSRILLFGIRTGAPLRDRERLFYAAARAGWLKPLRELHALDPASWTRERSKALRAALEHGREAGTIGGRPDERIAAICNWLDRNDRRLLAKRRASVARRRRLLESRRMPLLPARRRRAAPTPDADVTRVYTRGWMLPFN
jgi:hypothetical protein